MGWLISWKLVILNFFLQNQLLGCSRVHVVPHAGVLSVADFLM